MGPWCQTMWLEPLIFMVFCLHSYKLRLHLHSSKCCQNTCKAYVVWILFGHLHQHFNISLILFFHINECLIVALNIFHRILVFFFHLSGLYECLLNTCCWVATSYFSPKHFAWHSTNFFMQCIVFQSLEEIAFSTTYGIVTCYQMWHWWVVRIELCGNLKSQQP